MPASLNKAQLIGRLGKDPEERKFDGGSVVNFTLATSKTWKDKETEEPRERTQWHQIAVFNAALGEVTMRYLKKGSLVYVEGQLETRKWRGNDGAEHYTTEVVLRPYRGEITMLDPAPRSARAEQPTRAPARKARTPATAPAPGSRR